MADSTGAAALSEAFFRSVVDSASDAILTKDTEGIVTSWNRGATRVFGYTADEMIGRAVTVLFPPDRLAEEPDILRRVLLGERVENFQTVRRRKDGRLIDVSVTISPIRDASGKVIGASKIARDITLQKESDEWFEVTLGSIGDAVIAADVDGNVTFLNVNAERLTGWSRVDAAGRRLDEVFQLVDEQTGVSTGALLGDVLAYGRNEGHTLLRPRQGQAHPIENTIAPIRGRDGELKGVVVVFRDISERRQNELSARRLAAIIDGSDDAIVGKNLTSIVTSWNPGAERLFGYTAEEMVGQSILRLFPPDRMDEEQQILARLQRGERVDHFETMRMRKDGSIVEVSVTISPVRDSDGRIVGASKIARDITALRNAERKLQAHSAELEVQVRERTGKLQETVAELEAFSYSLSHDMRAPIRAIQSFSELVMADLEGKIPAESLDMLEKIIASARRLDRLIQDVLAFSRVSRAKIALSSVDVTRLVSDLVGERPELREPAATIKINSPLAPVIGHEASLTQIFTNLLQNGVKFILPGRKPYLEIFSEPDGAGWVRLCVRDNGIGIDKTGQERLFAIFNRLPTAHQYPGTGIGLAIVRKAAERMDGTVGINSTPGQGSTFWVRLREAT